MEYLEEFRMIVKPYKLNKSFVELLYDFSDEKNYDILINDFYNNNSILVFTRQVETY